jgi:hypothetical protein
MALLLVLGSLPSTGQGVTARLAGTVKDPGGGVVPEAALSATNTNIGVLTRTTSDPSGNYVFPLLPPGMYTLSVEKGASAQAPFPGFP